jgi:hypothetical protein
MYRLLRTYVNGISSLKKQGVWAKEKSHTILRVSVYLLESITKDMLQKIWNEIDYRLDVVRVIRGTYIEYL